MIKKNILHDREKTGNFNLSRENLNSLRLIWLKVRAILKSKNCLLKTYP